MTTAYGILSTYPPTQCGLATFSAAFVEALRSPIDHVGVVSVVDAVQPHAAPEVHHQWVRSQPGGAQAAAAWLDGYDAVIVQHEYGIFGGPDGADVLQVVRALSAPVVTVLHTVLVEPTPRQRAILEELARLSHTVVTMTHTANARLLEHYDVDPGRLRVIPHGADDTEETPARAGERLANRAPLILTWGLLGKGKGIEWAIPAMAALRDLHPTPRYHIVGETHPKVFERDGEAYREALQARAREVGVEDMVSFDSRYHPSPQLHRIVQAADIVLLPYDSREQVTSGVLVEAVSAGKPVVSTRFPHAVELLGGGAGLLVDRQNPEAIAAALRRLLTEPGLARRMSARARLMAPDLRWSAVAQQYRDVAAAALGHASVRVSA